jgi:hypothetical protein
VEKKGEASVEREKCGGKGGCPAAVTVVVVAEGTTEKEKGGRERER